MKGQLEYHVDADSDEWSVIRFIYSTKLFGDIFKINVPLTEQTFTPLTTDLYYCKKELGEECVSDHNHLNAVLRVYVQNKCNPHWIIMKKNYKPNEMLMLRHTDFKGYVLDGEILDWYLFSKWSRWIK